MPSAGPAPPSTCWSCPPSIWRRSRPWAYVLLLVFNLVNSQLFYIGMFPWAMILLSTLFFEPDWPRRLGLIPAGPPPGHAGAKPKPAAAPPRAALAAATRWALGAWVLLAAFDALPPLPLPGQRGLDRRRPPLFLADEDPRQAGRGPLRPGAEKTQQVIKLEDAEAPAHRKAAALPVAGSRADPPIRALSWPAACAPRATQDFEIRAFTSLSLNESPAQPLIDPEVDLAAQPETVMPKPWIVPLKPLPPGS